MLSKPIVDTLKLLRPVFILQYNRPTKNLTSKQANLCSSAAFPVLIPYFQNTQKNLAIL